MLRSGAFSTSMLVHWSETLFWPGAVAERNLTVIFFVGCVLVPLGIIVAAAGAAVWWTSRKPNAETGQ